MRLLTILAATVATGCAAPDPLPARTVVEETVGHVGHASEATPQATFRVLNHLAWPFRLSRVMLVTDGTVVRNQVFPRGAAPSSISVSIPVAPGNHALQILAEAQVSLTAGGPECAARVRSSTPFVADEAIPAEIKADLYLRPPPSSFADKLAVKIDVRGARRDAWVGQRAPAADEARCRPLRAPDRAMCRVEAMVAEAIRQRDVIKLLCNRDKLDQMKVLARLRDEAASLARTATIEVVRPALRRSPPIFSEEIPAETDGGASRVDVAEQRDRVLVLERTIEVLGHEADQCVGEEPIYFGGPMVTIDEECFEQAVPRVDLDLPATTPR